MRKNVLLLILGIPLIINAQERESKGKFSGEWRNYYSQTINKDSLKDFYALATGLKLKYDYNLTSSLSLSGALYSTYNTGIQDLAIPDEYTGRPSRYELGLFDVEDPNKKFIGLIGELNVAYARSGSTIKLGRFKLNTPFLNPQDGRMIPTLEEGLWYSFKKKESKFTGSGGVITRISPRSSSKFYGIGESVGVYPTGRSTIGAPSFYKGNTNSDFILIQNIGYSNTEKGFSIEMWNYFVDNLMNTFYLTPQFSVITDKLTISGQWLHQDRVGEGGNADPSLRYIEQAGSDVFGVKSTLSIPKGSFSLSYNYISAKGRFLFPREWGRESLYSFQKRERSEGSGNRHMLVAYFKRNWNVKDDIFKTDISLGYHIFGDDLSPSLNKYAMLSYGQINIDLFYQSKTWSKIKPELLIAYKFTADDIPRNTGLIFNKSDMWQINFIVNYVF